jgi:hypothetical protein
MLLCSLTAWWAGAVVGVAQLLEVAVKLGWQWGRQLAHGPRR